MPLLIFLFFFRTLSYTCPANNSFGTEISYDLTLGDTRISLVVWSPVSPPQPGLRFLNLHQNENTSVVAAKTFLLSQGSGSVWYWKKDVTFPTRNLQFKISSTPYEIDPNRMFTPVGIQKSLTPWTPEAGKVVYNFGKQILSLWDGHLNNSEIVAIHNNAISGSLSAESYLPGQVYASDAANVSVGRFSPKQFFLFANTPTGKSKYSHLADQGFAVVLQSFPSPAGPLQDDGSLSYFAATTNREYVNIEAGAPCPFDTAGIALLEQLNMIRALAAIKTN